MGNKLTQLCSVLVVASGSMLYPSSSFATVDAASTVTTLRLADTITGGYMPTTDPLFAQMLTRVQAGDIAGAANIAATSSYFANYLARRLALQMQNPNLDASVSTDNDSTAFLIAHFVGTATTKPSISTMLSDNSTYLVNGTHAAGLTAAQLAAVNWSTALTASAGQTARSVVNGTATATAVTIPAQHVGGFVTLSDRINDNSFAQYGATAGTNLRMIEGIWEISTGLSLVDVESTAADPQLAPRFVPEYDPNFFHGQGQAACISCHGGGMSSLDHGYSTVADLFDFDAKQGLTYNSAPTVSTMKSLASDPTLRALNATCNLAQNPTAVCNPDSLGADPNQAWNVEETWGASGVLNTMAWNGPTSGTGLNALGQAIGQAGIVYEFMAKRVINEICPMGIFSAARVSQIAAAVNPYAQPAGTDDIRTMVVLIASDASCQ